MLEYLKLVIIVSIIPVFVISGFVSSKVNSNTLFIPTAGYYNGSDIILAGSGCYLQSSSLLLSDLSRASILELELSDIYITHRSRYFGFSIRPVIKL